MNTYDVIVIGSGPAGLTAALYASRAELSVIVFEGEQPGGQLTITSEVENYPGVDSIDGYSLVDSMRIQAEKFNTKCIQETVTKINFDKNPFVIYTRNNSYITKSLIIATGASARWLNIPSEIKFINKGISACATCDGYFFKDQDIIVVGGGDSAMEEATFLTKFAKSVTIVHRKDTFRASKIMVSRAKENPKIKFKTPFEIKEFIGDSSVEKIQLINTKTKQISTINATGVFMAIGHIPNTKLFNDKLLMDDDGYLLTDPGSTKTNIEGVFACGDVQDRIYRQAITAAGSGCMAALDAERFLNEKN